MSDVLVLARYPRRPTDGYNDMTRRKRVNQYITRLPCHEVIMDVVCYYRTISCCNVETRKERAHQQRKEKPTPKSESGEKNEIK